LGSLLFRKSLHLKQVFFSTGRITTYSSFHLSDPLCSLHSYFLDIIYLAFSEIP
jgi:hypothetical protein